MRGRPTCTTFPLTHFLFLDGLLRHYKIMFKVVILLTVSIMAVLFCTLYATLVLFTFNSILLFFSGNHFLPGQELSFSVCHASQVLLEHHRTLAISCDGTTQESSDMLYLTFYACTVYIRLACSKPRLVESS